MSSTAEAPTVEEPLVAQRNDEVLFLARRRELRLVKVPIYPILSQVSGQRSGRETEGQTVAFMDGRFSCPTKGEVEIESGRKVDAKELLEWLQDHRLNGDSSEGFWQVDQEAPAPTTAELKALLEAVSTFDRKKLEKLREQEVAGWGRAQILDLADEAITRLRAQEASLTPEEREKLGIED